jgi:hypothetical protein
MDTEEMIHMIFTKRSENGFEPFAEAVVIELNLEDVEMKLNDIADKYCPGFEYFLELNIVQDFMEDLEQLDEYRSVESKVNRVIHYAEFDA